MLKQTRITKNLYDLIMHSQAGKGFCSQISREGSVDMGEGSVGAPTAKKLDETREDLKWVLSIVNFSAYLAPKTVPFRYVCGKDIKTIGTNHISTYLVT